MIFCKEVLFKKNQFSITNGTDGFIGPRYAPNLVYSQESRVRYSRVRLFPGSVIPGFGHSWVRSFPGFGHSRYLNAELSYLYTLAHVRHHSEPRTTEPELPRNDRIPGSSGSVVFSSECCATWTKVSE